MLSSSPVAFLRSDNECNAKAMKRSRTIQQGVSTSNLDLKRLDNMWIAWGFQENVMHEKCVIFLFVYLLGLGLYFMKHCMCKMLNFFFISGM